MQNYIFKISFIFYLQKLYFLYYKLISFYENQNAGKQARNMPGMTTTRLPYTDYYLTIRRARISVKQRE